MAASNKAEKTALAESRDEVDFIATHNNNNDYDDYSVAAVAHNSGLMVNNKSCGNAAASATATAVTAAATTSTINTPNHNEPNGNTLKKSKERRALFSFGKKANKSQATAPAAAPAPNGETPAAGTPANPANQPVAAATTPLLLTPKPAVPIGTPPRTHKFVKSSSIARLLGNTYNAKKFEKQEAKRLANEGKFNTYGGHRRTGPYLERFKRMSKEDGDIAGSGDTVTVTNMVTLTTDSRDLFGGSRHEHVGRQLTASPEDLSAHKAMRTLTRSLGKLWFKRTHSVDISTPDPEFKVCYLGNVLTGWAKGEGCVEKQLNTLWRNYTQHSKPDVIMRIKVCASGLKATTRQHGLTEYWANRITYCCAPKNYPRVFCWIYRHEGRKLKHELRCHAVLCSKDKIAQDICDTLKENLESALREFKREKILKQNARLSLANAVYDNPSLPRRKIMLSVGGNNYRPPLERSKSAPKLMAIEEAIGEEEGDEIEDTNEPEMKPCCQRDSLYPAMTLGRRRCRRGHSIRRTGKIQAHAKGSCCAHQPILANINNKQPVLEQVLPVATNVNASSDGSDTDEFEKLLKYNNYDTNTTLSTELLPYFDMQLHKNTSQSLGSLSELKDEAEPEEEEPLSLLPTINSDPSAHPQADYDTTELDVALRRSGICSDGEEEDYLDDADDHYFRQAALLNMLHRNSMRKMNTNLGNLVNDDLQLNYRHQPQSSISSNASSVSSSAASAGQGAESLTGGAGSSATGQKQQQLDSDEGSISSGCETASTVTNANHEEELAHKYKQSTNSNENEQQTLLLEEIIYQRLESTRLQVRHNSDATNYSSSSSITLKLSTSPTTSINELDVMGNNQAVTASNGTRLKRVRKHSTPTQRSGAVGDSDDSECSDESGYVEFQEKEKAAKEIVTISNGAVTKPQLPPKPMPRRSLNAGKAI